ncbi:hypothetical protein DXG01_016972 [Tephrocybe rancida]|nr:hypothetical protein DXG01_016972 [Tephrocybe rancida]
MTLPNVSHILAAIACCLWFLSIPTYYASQAIPILQSAQLVLDGESADDVRVTRRSNHDTEQFDAAEGIDLGIMPTSHLDVDCNISPLPTPPAASIPELSVPDTNRVRLNETEALWTTYIERRCKEWRILISIAGTILVASPPLLQMPGTNGDPIVRGFVYLSIFRLIATVFSALALMYYFHKSHFGSATFVLSWCQISGQRHYPCAHAQYITLASPVISFTWGIIFIILAFFLTLWRGGLSTNASPMTNTHPLASVSVRIIITAMSLVDVAWISWLVVTLKYLEAGTQVVPFRVVEQP